MKRLASFVKAASLVVTLLLASTNQVFATPFNDVPANHWAYQALQSLAADGLVEGFPDAQFKGDRPLTRYEMAVITARVIAKVEANGASRADLDKVQELINGLKDELDALGVRVTNVEDAIVALDKRTQFAQRLEMHGLFLPNLSLRQRLTIPSTYGAGSTLGTCAFGATTTCLDPLVSAYLFTDNSDNPLTSTGSGVRLRDDNRWSLTYHVNDNIDLSIPVHVLTYNYGGAYDATSSSSTRLELDPGVDIKVAKAGGVWTNLDFKFGVIDDMKSSRTGLAFTSPAGFDRSGVYVPYDNPIQPYQKGVSVAGTLFGLTDFRASYTRIDPVMLDTFGGLDPNCLCDNNTAGYLLPVTPPQVGYNQTSLPGKPTTQTFTVGPNGLEIATLNNTAVNGSVYISAYDGSTFDNTGAKTGGSGPAAPPSFTFNGAYNALILGKPLVAGETMTVTYTALSAQSNTTWQRYMINARINQKIKGWSGAEVGLTFNRIFDFNDFVTQGNLSTTYSSASQPNSAAWPFGLVSDTVYGIDFQAPLGFEPFGKGSEPMLTGEYAHSAYTPNYQFTAPVGDWGGVIGVRMKIAGAQLSGAYQRIGVNYIDGAPIRYYGNQPALLSNWNLPYLGSFYGFANNLGVNQAVDNAFAAAGLSVPGYSSGGVNTSIYTVFNPFNAALTPYFYQNPSFAPNSAGFTLGLTAPVRIGDLTVNARLNGKALQELTANASDSTFFGTVYPTSTKMTDSSVTAGIGVSIPVLGRRLGVDISGGWENLSRNDRSGYPYYPVTIGTGLVSSGPTINGALGTSPVSFYPNYVNDTKTTFAATASLPISHDVVLSGSYFTERYAGEWGTTLAQNINEHKDFYVGTIQYNIPKTTSSVNFQAKQYRYTDNYLPTFNTVQNRQDVNFTVRF